MIVGVSFVVGPTVASLILSVAAWPWLFAVNVPLGLLALAFAWPALPHTERGKHNFDPIAALHNVITFAALIFALARRPSDLDAIGAGRGRGRRGVRRVADSP